MKNEADCKDRLQKAVNAYKQTKDRYAAGQIDVLNWVLENGAINGNIQNFRQGFLK